MRRAVLALLGTTIGTSLLVGAKLGTTSPVGAQDLAADPGGVGGAAGTDPGALPGPSGAPGASSIPGTPGASALPGRSAGTTAKPGSSQTTPAGTTRSSSSPKPPTSGYRDGTFAGAASTNQYGTIKVTVTISGGKITDARASYPTSPSRTASINADAIPKLRQEALAAQSAKIATVSGATYTSGSYRTSLQSALDQARA